MFILIVLILNTKIRINCSVDNIYIAWHAFNHIRQLLSAHATHAVGDILSSILNLCFKGYFKWACGVPGSRRQQVSGRRVLEPAIGAKNVTFYTIWNQFREDFLLNLINLTQMFVQNCCSLFCLEPIWAITLLDHSKRIYIQQNKKCDDLQRTHCL